MKPPKTIVLMAAIACLALKVTTLEPMAAEAGATPASNPPASAAASVPTPVPQDPAEERLVLMAFEDTPIEVIRTLAEQAGIPIRIDPAVSRGVDGEGKPIQGWKDPVAVRWENATAREALLDFLGRYKFEMVSVGQGKLMLIQPAGQVRIAEAGAGGSTNAASPGAKGGAKAGAPGSKGAAKPAAAAGDDPKPIRLEDQPVLEAIATLAQAAHVNFQFDPRISSGQVPAESKGMQSLTNSSITVRWENVTYKQALDSVLENYGLMLVPNTNTLIARITYKPDKEPMQMRVVQLRYANPTNVVTMLTQAVPTARTKEDGRTSSILIQATEKEMAEIETIITRLDTPTKQVLIEAKIMETSKNPKTVKGIDWSGTLTEQNFRFGNGVTSGETLTRAPGSQVTTTTTLPSGRQITTTSQTPYDSASSLSTVTGNGGLSMDTARGLFPNVAFLSADGVKAALSFLNTDADTEVVATPRTVTLDNQMARLSVTKLYPNYKIVPGSANSPASADITYTNLGTVLEVTPRIAGTNLVSLKVAPEVGNVDSVDRKLLNGSFSEANVYAIRRIETQVLIPSGNTLVMGGLMSDNRSKGFTKVPVLGDLPGIGLAFRKESKQRTKSNMIIFVTPTIVQDQDFQPTETDFLKTKPTDPEEPTESAWDSGKPYDWKAGLKPIKSKSE